MQFTNTSGVTSQTDTNQHNAGGELHARLRNDEQHTSTPGPAGVEGAGGAGGPDRRAGGRRRSLSTHKRQARTIGGAARPAGPGRTSHRHPDRLEAAARPAGPGRGAGGRWQGLAGFRDRPLRAQLAARTASGRGAAPLVWRTPGARPRCRWAAAGPGRASRSTTPSAARVWRSRGRGAAHRHQHAGTNTQPQTHRHNEAARPHRGRAAHTSGRYAAISEVFSASGCRWRPGARRPRRRGRPCRPRPTCPTYAGRTASSRRPRRRS